ncbi:5'-3' exoribonuclease 2 [Apiospora arundinis]
MGGYMTKDGDVDLEKAQFILNGLAKQEDAIFKRRREGEERREANAKRRRLNDERNGRFNNQNRNGNAGIPASLSNTLTHDMVINRSAVQDANAANKSAAAVLKSQIQGLMPKEPTQDGANNQESPSALAETPPPAKPDPSEDTVKLWEDGYADRYYEQKFHADPKDIEFRHSVARAYVEGLAWVLKYYFQGCASWEWYYPYHYAPFAQDFVDIVKTKIDFKKGRTSKPFEQLLSVQPAASKHVLPEVFHDLMTDPESDIIDFYPEEFEIDLNGKKMAWQGVALLPFIDMPRLLAAAEKKYPLLSPEDRARNEPGKDVLLLSEANQELYDDVIGNFYSKKQGDPIYTLDPKASQGLSGVIEKMPEYLPHCALDYPLERKAFPDLDDDRSLTVHYEMPKSSHTHKSMLLPGAKLPTPALNNSDIEELKGKMRNSGRSHGGAPFGRGGYGGRGRGMHYGPDSRGGRQDRPRNNGYGNGHGHQQQGSNPFPAPPPGWVPPGWIPPPPGQAGFGAGLPPPPPGAYGGNYQQPQGGQYGYQGGYQAPPPPPGYGGYNQPPPGRDQYGRGGGQRPYDQGRGRGGGGGYRGGRGYRG